MYLKISDFFKINLIVFYTHNIHNIICVFIYLFYYIYIVALNLIEKCRTH